MMLPKDHADAARMFYFTTFLLSAGSVASVFLIVPFAGPLSRWLGVGEAAPFVALAPVGIALLAWIRTAEIWLMRHRDFSGVASRRVVQSGIAVPAQIGLGLTGAGAFGLVGGLLGGYLVAGILLAARVAGRVRRPRGGGSATTSDLLRRYRRFPAFSMPSAVLNSFSVQLPAFLLIYYFDPAAAGFFALAYGVLIVPAGLMSSSVAQVFFPEAARRRHEGGLGELSASVFRRMVVLGLVPSLIVILLGPSLVAVVFGAEWREAGRYVTYLAPWIFLVLIGSPLSRLFDVLERQPVELALNIAMTVARLAALVWGGLAGDARLAVALFAGVSVAGWLLQIAILLRMAETFLLRQLRRSAGDAWRTLPALIPVAPALVWPGDLVAVGGALVGMMVFGMILWKAEPGEGRLAWR
jgi:lipopolysaccharide exporter